MTDARGGDRASSRRRAPDLVRALHSTSLDELPELINVSRGDEPGRTATAPPEYLPFTVPSRHDTRSAGITAGQVKRNAGAGRSVRSRRLHVDHHSLRLDLKIILLTIRTVLKREGISANGEATMSKFRGNADG
jgi:lipopolysaccharide/colanic/teichoic acid biosynthesis glycosyltransferase